MTTADAPRPRLLLEGSATVTAVDACSATLRMDEGAPVMVAVFLGGSTDATQAERDAMRDHFERLHASGARVEVSLVEYDPEAAARALEALKARKGRALVEPLSAAAVALAEKARR